MAFREVTIGPCRLICGDNLEAMSSMGVVDSVVTDPPAGIAFMDKEWDDFRRARNPNDCGRDSVFGRTSARGPEYAHRSREQFVEGFQFIGIERDEAYFEIACDRIRKAWESRPRERQLQLLEAE